MIYVMSDIHGCYKEFIKALEVVNFNDNDELYILGDIVDRGDEPIKLLQDLINKNLHVMDITATSMCMDNDVDLVVFNMNTEGNILKAVKGEVDGTTISK